MLRMVRAPLAIFGQGDCLTTLEETDVLPFVQNSAPTAAGPGMFCHPLDSETLRRAWVECWGEQAVADAERQADAEIRCGRLKPEGRQLYAVTVLAVTPRGGYIEPLLRITG